MIERDGGPRSCFFFRTMGEGGRWAVAATPPHPSPHLPLSPHHPTRPPASPDHKAVGLTAHSLSWTHAPGNYSPPMPPPPPPPPAPPAPPAAPPPRPPPAPTLAAFFAMAVSASAAPVPAASTPKTARDSVSLLMRGGMGWRAVRPVTQCVAGGAILTLPLSLSFSLPVSLSSPSRSLFSLSHSTRAVRDSTFMSPRARSSCAAKPSTRVPSGAPLLLTSTHALRAKEMDDPSGRRSSLTVSVMTAFWTWLRARVCVRRGGGGGR
jgi:hypothetical protein